jgi:two-component system, cell cycle sensor histidine kinase and response regulator CckA
VARYLEKGERNWSQEYRLITRSGEVRWFRDDNVALEDRIQAVVYDITERKRMEEALRESERRLNKSQEIAHLGSWDLDLLTNRLIWSDEVYRILGLGRELVSTYETFLDAVHPEDRSAVDEAFSGSLQEGKDSYEIEHRVVRKNSGEIRYVHERCEHIRDSSGRIVRSVGMVQDITERKQAEMAFALSEEKYRKAFFLSPLWVVLSTLEEGRYIEVNETFLKTTGFNRREVIGRTGIDLGTWVRPGDRARIVAELEKIGSVKNIEVQRRTQSGTVLNMLFSAETVEIEGRKVMLSVSQDITEQKTLETELRQAQKMEAIGTLAGGIAHDFNNLLQAIGGYTQLLLWGKRENDPGHFELKEIEKAAGRAAVLIRQLLAFSRRVEGERRPMNLNQEVKHIENVLARTIPKMIRIEIHPGKGLWAVQADPIQIEQVLLNLGSNAADAMPEGGRLIIETFNVSLDEQYCRNHLGAAPGRYVLLSVSDTGHGMDRETVQHIFEPFFTTKKIGKGTGLGLASVYGIIKSCGGYVMCYSEVGQGTTFKIYLPALEGGTGSTRKEEEEALPQGGNETILVVDDESAIRDFARKTLQRFGYNVLLAESGEEALEISKGRMKEIDLFILDIGMPGMGGYACLGEILKIDPSARVLIASGYSVNGRMNEILRSGAAGYIGKPYQLRNLLRKVRAILDSVHP